MLKVQEYLLTHSFTELFNEHGVNVRPSTDFSKWSLNYDQLAAKAGDPLADECRGLVLRPASRITDLATIVGSTTIVARPMDRFYNAGDSNAAPIDWSTSRIQEKLDGTMTILYFDFVKNEWCVGTRSVCEADVVFGDCVSPLKENTFRELFFYAADKSKSDYFPSVDHWLDYLHSDKLARNCTYIFELTSPINRVVVKYGDYRITLLAVRETATGHYMSPDKLRKVGMPVVTEWPLKTLADIEAFLLDSDPAKVEGAVVIDANNNRLKVKSKQWVLASRAKDSVSVSKRNALQCIIDGTLDDVLPLLDDGLQEYLRKMQEKTAAYCKQIDSTFAAVRAASASSDRKAFALGVQASGLWQTPFFNLYGGKWDTTIDWLRHLSATKKLTDSTLDTLLKEVG
jgi:hypothetical protein